MYPHILIAPSEPFRVYQIADKPIRIVLYIVHAPVTSMPNVKTEKNLTNECILCSQLEDHRHGNVYRFGYEDLLMDAFSAEILTFPCCSLF